MHWISLISFCLIIYICQAEPSTVKQLETEQINKVSSIDIPSNGNNVPVSHLETPADDAAHASTTSTPAKTVVKQEKIEQHTLKLVANSGHNHHCYVILPFIIAGLMGIVRF